MQHTMRIDHGRYVFIDGKRLNIQLSNKEGQILNIILRSTAVVTPDILLNQIYGGLDEPNDTKIFTVFVCKLRFKLGAHRDMIQTVWGRGWMRNPKYVREEHEVATLQIDVPMEYADSISFITGKDAQTAILDIVKSAYKQLQEM